MIFESVKLLRVVNRLELMMEELFILQVIYDYQEAIKNLNREEIKELSTNYLSYFEKFGGKYDAGGTFECPNPWRNLVEKLLRDDWIVDRRIDKSKLKFTEFEVSQKFLDAFKGSKTDEELYQIAKDIYPREFRSFSTAEPISSFLLKVEADNKLFQVFQKKILSGNRRDKWNEFSFITTELFEDLNSYAPSSFETYINTFNENKERYKRQIE